MDIKFARGKNLEKVLVEQETVSKAATLVIGTSEAFCYMVNYSYNSYQSSCKEHGILDQPIQVQIMFRFKSYLPHKETQCTLD